MPDTFTVVKSIHLACAALSLGGFMLRGIWMLRGSSLLQTRPTRVLPHVNDTLLFSAGLWLMIATAQYPDQHAWLTAKLIAIVVYILLGMVALRRGRSLRVRTAAFFGALATFGYIVAVAMARSPWPL